jgi:hypothetical protein
MNRHRLGNTLFLTAVCAVCGCQLLEKQSEKQSPPPDMTQSERPIDYKQHVRNNCASLLYSLLSDEKNLSKLLIVKQESDQLHSLVKNISKFAGDGARELEQFTGKDGAFDVHVSGLPSGEAVTRESVSKDQGHELLEAKGADFEFKLLLTQVEALNYGAHLAKVAAENESASDRIQAFARMQTEMESLRDQVRAMLRR